MRETMHDIRSSLSDIAQIELMYRDTEESDDEYHTHEKIKSRPQSSCSTDSNSTQSNTKNPIHRTSLPLSPKDILMKKRDSGKNMSQIPIVKSELDIVRESDENTSNYSSYSAKSPFSFQENVISQSEIPPKLPTSPPPQFDSSSLSLSSTSTTSSSPISNSNLPPPIPSYPPPSTSTSTSDINDESKYFQL